MSNAEFEEDWLRSKLNPDRLRQYQDIKRNRPWKLYSPIPAILPFHNSQAQIRVLAGPNRGGKTTAGAYEMICYATGYNPIRREHYDTPNICWAVALDHMNMGAIMKRTLFTMLPQGFKYYKMEGRIVLPNKSEIVLKSADSGREKFQGEGLTAAWFDEEPIGQEGHEIFKEVFARRKPGVPLRIFMTFTPLQGLSWSYRVLWDERSEERMKGVDCFTFELTDCDILRGGFLTTQEIESIASGYNEWERKARVHGRYTIMGGSPYFDPTLVVAAMDRCETAKKYKIRRMLGALPTISSIKLEESDAGELSMYRPPLKGHKYIAGVDVGGGVHKDATVISVWDKDDLAEVAQWYSNKVDPQLFGQDVLPAVGMLYNHAELVIEVNGEHGGTAVSQIRGMYKRIYMRQDWDSIQRRVINKYGFHTNTRTRGLLLDALKRCLRESSWKPSEPTLREMGTFITVDDQGYAEAMAGCKDDRVFAAALAILVHLENPTPKIDYESLRISYQRADGDWAAYG